MSRFRPSYIPALLSIGLGVYWVISQWLKPILRYPAETKPLLDFIFYYIALTFVLLPGLALVFFGTTLLRNIAKDSIKHCIGFLALLGSIWPVYKIEFLLQSLTGISRSLTSTSFLISAVISFILFFLICKYLMKAEGITIETKGEFINRGNLYLLAVFSALSLDELLKLLFPPKYDYSSMINEPWETITLILAIVIAVIFYFVVAHFIPKEKRKESLLFDDLSMEEVRKMALKKEPQDSC